VTQARGFERLFPLEVGERADKRRPGSLGDPLQVFLSTPPDSHGTGLDKLLEDEVVDPLGREDDVGTGRQDFLDTLDGNLGFLSSDGLDLVRVVDLDVNAEMHSLLGQVDVETSDLGSRYSLLHGCGAWSLLAR
jgi:hypothetical protein